MGQYSDLISYYEQRYNLPSGLLASLVQQENAPQNPNTVNYLGCRGLTQICPSHHCYSHSFDAQSQLDCTASSLASSYQKFGNWEQSVAEWYSGSHANDPSSWDRIGHPTISQYVSSIMGRVQAGGSISSSVGQIFTPGASTIQASTTKAIIIGTAGLLIVVAILGSFGQRPIRFSLPS